ncbi:hypothetical protein HTIA_2754 [Halorhabdus tiamatea SARL4B]|uniref:Uncharacterized protein n=1 Tax=Halorhabdus tiamatea SARL4B TaxID=1033806 RepID=S6D9A2_9EURY|nr:hypothetical protein HTIA_2754 [Halorhabdus tiamatea SARL4B]
MTGRISRQIERNIRQVSASELSHTCQIWVPLARITADRRVEQ